MGLFSNDNGKKLKDEGASTSLATRENEVNSVCLISKETLIKGTIETASMFQLEGVLEGDIKSESLVHIGITGRVKGNIDTESLLVDGEVFGEVSAERVEIGKTGKVFANIISNVFVIQEGGLFEGTKKTKINPVNEEEKLKLESKSEDSFEEEPEED
ncbi:MAG: polymer-forming cytoskeletal protein [Fusobacterium sp.]|uniref:bactofilin family protein n=1 Tax=Fusobacterium sp. TaxID=68766 RepID=UPI0026DC0DED|nr:polymer-forming cytoskeletal protein [Fusobacterium sp.]MDO4689866.1 polymer-forming cytoskeletal protein [Fusobacterium sp.]